MGADRSRLLAFVAAATAVALWLPASAAAISATFSVSAAPTAGSPVAVTTSGTSEFTSTTLQVAASFGTNCDPHIAVPFATHPSIGSSFRFTDTFVPPVPGAYCIYALLNGSGLGNSASATSTYASGTTIDVAPPPPPGAPTPGKPGTSTNGSTGSKHGSSGAKYCYVPHLHGATVAAARRKLAADGCRLGGVHVARIRPHLGRGQVARLVIDGQSFRPGARIPGGTAVTVHLGYVVRHV